MGEDGRTAFEFEPRKDKDGEPRKAFPRKTEPAANGHAKNSPILATTVIKAKSGARKRAAKKKAT